MSARHNELMGLVAAYADGELPAGPSRELEEHLRGCVSCRRELRVHEAGRARLRQEAASGVPTALRDRIFAALETRPTHRRVRWWWPVTGLAAVLAGLLVASPQGGRVAPPVETSRAGDSAAIIGLIQAHAAAWNRRDASAAAAVLTPDAIWVTSSGEELRGRSRIEQAHRQWLASDSTTTHVHPPESIAIRFLRPDVAIADLDGQFFGPPDSEGRARLREEARIFVVATKDGGVWHIAQLRNLRREVRGSSPR